MTQENIAPIPQPTETRYAVPRRCIDWYRTDHLKILKMLVWVITQREQTRGAKALWARVDTLLERIIKEVTGEAGITFTAVLNQTVETQGLEITPGKLALRAWNAQDNYEWNDLRGAVVRAYGKVTADWSGSERKPLPAWAAKDR